MVFSPAKASCPTRVAPAAAVPGEPRTLADGTKVGKALLLSSLRRDPRASAVSPSRRGAWLFTGSSREACPKGGPEASPRAKRKTAPLWARQGLRPPACAPGPAVLGPAGTDADPGHVSLPAGFPEAAPSGLPGRCCGATASWTGKRAGGLPVKWLRLTPTPANPFSPGSDLLVVRLHFPFSGEGGRRGTGQGGGGTRLFTAAPENRVPCRGPGLGPRALQGDRCGALPDVSRINEHFMSTL